MTTSHLPSWLAALHLPGIGPRTVMRWLEVFSTIEQVFSAPSEELQAAGVHPQHITALKNPDWQSVENDLAWAQTKYHHLITLDDEAYPSLLKEIHDPPLVLYVRGDIAALATSQLAMVGSRNATPAGLKNAESFAYHLAKGGIAITSGLALGIDGAAHRGALSAQGRTLAVMGTGFNYIYPASNRSLAEEIIRDRGAVISEFPLNTKPHPHNFPRRNRIISGLSMGVLVVEAALKSGSLITARHSLEQGREVFAIPGSIHNPLVRGCHHLIRQGAKLVEKADDILEELDAFRSAKQPRAEGHDELESVDLAPHSKQIFEQIGYEITPMDVILLRSQLTAGEVSSILLALELQGLIASIPGGYIRAQ